MRIIKVNPGSLLVTEGTYLDMETVRRYYMLFRKRRPVDPVILVQEPSNSHYYLADGNHISYAALLAKKIEINGKLLETDNDIRNYDLGKTKKFGTLDELLEYCRRQHITSNEFGLITISDYAFLYYMRPNWNSQ